MADDTKDHHSDSADDVACPTGFRQPAIHLTQEQLKQSTTELFAAHLPEGANPSDEKYHAGRWAHLRTKLDYSFHKVPVKTRQLLQDSILEEVLGHRNEVREGAGEDRQKPLVVFTAGAMASGKGHSLRYFLKKGDVSLPADFIWIDPDKLARMLPEREQYLDFDKSSAPEKLHAEAALMQEILSHIGREQHRSMVMDGSLSDGDWFKDIMAQYRKAGYELELFFVSAEIEEMVKRAEARAKETGRETAREHIERSAKEAPESVAKLASRDHVDRVRLVDNSDDSEPPTIVYDSKGDPCFEKEGRHVNVGKYVDEQHEMRISKKP